MCPAPWLGATCFVQLPVGLLVRLKLHRYLGLSDSCTQQGCCGRLGASSAVLLLQAARNVQRVILRTVCVLRTQSLYPVVKLGTAVDVSCRQATVSGHSA